MEHLMPVWCGRLAEPKARIDWPAMRMSRRSLIAIVVCLILSAVAVWCFVRSLHYWNAGIVYVAETSSNPNPSERARVMGSLLMGKSTAWFNTGAILTALIVMVFMINLSVSALLLSPRDEGLSNNLL